MEFNYCECQVCLFRFDGISDFKRHVRSRAHQKKMEEVFQKDKFSEHGFFPEIIVMDPKTKKDIKHPVVGLNLLTLCFSPETTTFFYLCHICEEICPPHRLLCHLFSSDHCSNYFSYTDPNVLRFSWLPGMNMGVTLRAELTRESNECRPRHLQVLDLPENLLKKLENSTYSEVMQTLTENEKLLKLLEAGMPKRTMIQTYRRDSNRKHPLLGMQHIIECICVGPAERRYYLCTLCNLTLTPHMIIKHVLSFDHIFCYFRAWHPSTLMSKQCYQHYTDSFVSTMLHFAKQTEEIHGTANTHMKQVRLEPAKFTSVNFTCYAEALKELESITKENMKSSLITSVKPGNKLERHAVSALLYKLHCQDCNMSFNTASQYSKHLSGFKHKQMLRKFFGKDAGANGDDQRGCTVNLGLYRYHKETLKQNQPAIGVSLVVACVSSQVQRDPIYVCFACRDCFCESGLRQHFASRKHLIRTLLYLNPWRLPFAWEKDLDVEVLRSMAWEEEKERGPNQMKLKVLDVPYCIFWELIPCYPEVMATLELHHTLLKREVPRCETNSKLQQNERFPLLGQQFMVMHDAYSTRHQSTKVAFLCLLCGRSLSDMECYAHVFSLEHVTAFLDRFHPGSLNSTTDAQTLLDLAKQAARIHPVFHVQEIKLDKPLWEPYSYNKAKFILGSAKKRAGEGQLEPIIKPKMKLVPRESLKDVDKGLVRDSSQGNSQMMEGSEKKSDQKCTENNETTLKMISAEVSAEVTNTPREESKDNVEKMDCKESPAPSEKESERISEEIKNAGSETCQVKMEKMEEPAVRNPSGETRESCQSETREERSETSKDILTQEQKQLTTADKGDSGKPNHETAKDKDSSNVNHQQALWQYVKRRSREPLIGFGALFECCCDRHDPIYLCECCSLMIPERDVISHVTGAYHQKLYLGKFQKLTLPPEQQLRENIRHLATLFEQENGYGEAQVVDLDEETYNNILKQNFKSAMQTVKALQAQDGCRELPWTSAPSAVLPVDTSVTLQSPQREVCSFSDDHQVVDMEVVDDSEDSEAQPSSVTAAASVITETNSNTHMTVSRSHEDASSLHVSASGTNTTCLEPDSTGNEVKAEIIPNTTVAPLKIASDSAVTTSTVSMTVISKRPVESSRSNSDASKSPAPVSTACRSVVTTSSATATTTITTRQTAASGSSSTTSRNSETAPQTTRASKAMVTAVNADTVLKKNLVGPNADVAANVEKSNAPAASHLTALKSKNRSLPTERSHTSRSKTKPSKSPPKVGVSQLIVVSCGKKQQVFCQLCSVKLKHSSHVLDFRHQYNYVKMRFPEWTAKPSELKRKLKKMVGQLAAVEKDVVSGLTQKKKLNSDEYKKLAALPVHKALERLKAMMRPEDSQVSSSTSDTAVLRPPAASASPCEASRPDDETESISKEEGNPAAGQSDRAQSLKSPEPEAHELISDQLQPCLNLIENEPEPMATSTLQDTAAVTMEIPEACVDPLSSASESEGGFAQIPDERQETAETRQQQERSDPELQDTQKVLECTQKTSTVHFFQPDPLPAAASVKPEQNQSRPSQKAGHVSGFSAGPGQHSASQALSRISVGKITRGHSCLYTYLTVSGLDNEQVIGLGSVWECRSPKQSTFFLCESCRETLHPGDVCQHMVSVPHQLNYVRTQRPEWYKSFWLEDLLQNMKLEILKDVAGMLSKQERYEKIDAKVILLREDLYKHIQTAPFSEALKLVQNIEREPKLSCLPISALQQKDQQPEQSQEESPPTAEQSTQAPERDQRGDNEAVQETEKHHFEETTMAGDLLGVKQERVLSPLDVTSVSSKADSVVFPCPGADTRQKPQESYSSPSMQPELRPLDSQRCVIESHSESPSSSVVSPEASQTLSVSPRDKCLPIRKRPAVTSLEAPVRPATNKCQLEDPLPAKRTCGSLQPISQCSTESASESTPVCRGAAPNLLSLQDKDPGTRICQMREINYGPHTDLIGLIATLREKRAEVKTSANMSALYDANTTCADNSSEYGVERSRCPMYAQTGSKMPTKRTRWHSKQKVVNDTVKKNSSEGTFSTAAPVVSGFDNQLTTSSAGSANHSSPEGYLATEAKAVGTMLRSASTADPGDPQHQRSVIVEHMVGTVRQVKPRPFQWVAMNHCPGQIPKPQGHTEADSTGDFRIPISTIVTTRPDPLSSNLGGYNQQNRTEMNTSNQVACSFFTVQTGYCPPGAVTGYTTPNNPLVYTGRLHQNEGYTTRLSYPSQFSAQNGLQEANRFGHSLVTPMPSAQAHLEMQQQLITQPQQYSTWSSAAIGDNRTNAYAVPLTTSANSSQLFINLNDYRTNRITRHNYTGHPSVYLSPEITSQTPAHSFTVAPTMINNTLPVPHDATR
ncbi:uncharacterized protein LOC143335276 [Chaetodon auriga]|uniref:uncharacterized protein LOC143335276 n=1 Tax=Chaetodon auriga TaxID=39042 RepID=UPI0040331178